MRQKLSPTFNPLVSLLDRVANRVANHVVSRRDRTPVAINLQTSRAAEGARVVEHPHRLRDRRTRELNLSALLFKTRHSVYLDHETTLAVAANAITRFPLFFAKPRLPDESSDHILILIIITLDIHLDQAENVNEYHQVQQDQKTSPLMLQGGQPVPYIYRYPDQNAYRKPQQSPSDWPH